jgi:hypothetical protein
VVRSNAEAPQKKKTRTNRIFVMRITPRKNNLGYGSSLLFGPMGNF